MGHVARDAGQQVIQIKGLVEGPARPCASKASASTVAAVMITIGIAKRRARTVWMTSWPLIAPNSRSMSIRSGGALSIAARVAAPVVARRTR